MDYRQPVDFSGVVEKIDDAPRAKLGHCEPRNSRNCLLVVE
jgi:hypothetical protein